MASYGVLKCEFPVLKRGYHYVNSDFGNRTYTNCKGKKVSDYHKGIDIQGKDPKTDDVLCPFDGIVIGYRNNMSGTASSGTDAMGNYVIIDCGGGVRLRFMHLKKGSVTVKTGDKVKAGQVIGYMGLTGNTSGYHLHFDISIGGTAKSNYVDPKPYLAGTKSLPIISLAKPQKGTYVITSDVNVRKGPGVNYDRIYFSQFTSNAKKQVKALDNSCPDYFPAGVRLTVKEFKQAANGKWWGKCPTGWICMSYLKLAD